MRWNQFKIECYCVNKQVLKKLKLGLIVISFLRAFFKPASKLGKNIRFLFVIFNLVMFLSIATYGSEINAILSGKRISNKQYENIFDISEKINVFLAFWIVIFLFFIYLIFETKDKNEGK